MKLDVVGRGGLRAISPRQRNALEIAARSAHATSVELRLLRHPLPSFRRHLDMRALPLLTTTCQHYCVHSGRRLLLRAGPAHSQTQG